MTDGSGWRDLRPPLKAGPSQVSATPFARLGVTHGLAAAGDACIAVALAGSLFFDISPSAARSRIALSLLLTIAPFGVVAPFLGPAIDRMRGGRRAMIFFSAAGRAGLCLLLIPNLDGLPLFPLAFGTLVLGKAHGVAKSSLVPASVESEDQLVEANSKLALIAVVGGLLGSVPAVVALKLGGGEWSLALGVGFFAAAALFALRLAEGRKGTAEDETATDRAQLMEHHVVLAAGAMGVLRGCAGLLTFLLAFSFRRSNAPAWWFGVALLASMGGTLCGAVIAPRLRGIVREERILIGTLVAVAATCTLAARADTRPTAALTAGAIGLAASASKLAFDALVQRDAPGAAHGRTFARFEAAFQLAWVVGALIPTLLTISDRTGFFLMAVACAVTGLGLIAGSGSPGPGEVTVQDA